MDLVSRAKELNCCFPWLVLNPQISGTSIIMAAGSPPLTPVAQAKDFIAESFKF